MSNLLTKGEKANIMAETAQHLINMIQKRLANRVATLNSLATSPLDNIPDEVKKMRAIECSVIRAVMQEQSDLIEIIRTLFPNTITESDEVERPKKRKTKNAKV